jgi:hypothetical protein
MNTVRLTYVPPINWGQTPSKEGVFFGPVTVRSSSHMDSNVRCSVCKYRCLYFDLHYFVYDSVYCSVKYRDFQDHPFAKFSVILTVDTNNKVDIRLPKINYGKERKKVISRNIESINAVCILSKKERTHIYSYTCSVCDARTQHRTHKYIDLDPDNLSLTHTGNKYMRTFSHTHGQTQMNTHTQRTFAIKKISFSSHFFLIFLTNKSFCIAIVIPDPDPDPRSMNISE